MTCPSWDPSPLLKIAVLRRDVLDSWGLNWPWEKTERVCKFGVIFWYPENPWYWMGFSGILLGVKNSACHHLEDFISYLWGEPALGPKIAQEKSTTASFWRCAKIPPFPRFCQTLHFLCMWCDLMEDFERESFPQLCVHAGRNHQWHQENLGRAIRL